MTGSHQLGASVGVRGPDGLYRRPLTASEKGEQDEQVWRADKRRAAWEAELAQRNVALARWFEMRAAARRAG